jgi:hypothetical protein
MRTVSYLFILSGLMISGVCVIVGAGAWGAAMPTTMPAAMATTMAAAATAPTTSPVVIDWDQAKDHIGQKAIVTGPVIGMHDFGDAAVLNIGKNFPDPSRFTVYLSADQRKALPADLDVGKTISVTGKLKLFHKVPEIEGDAKQITIIAPSTTAPASQPWFN